MLVLISSMPSLNGKSNPLDQDLFKLIKQLRFSSVGFYFVGFLIPIISFLSLKISGLQLGFVFSLRTIGFTVSALFAGFLSNKRELRPKLIFGASVGRFVSYILTYFSFMFNLYWMMTLGMLILGFGAGFFWTPFETTVADATEYEHRSEAFGKFSQQSGIGGFIGASVGFTILWTASEFTFSSEIMYSAIAFSPLLLYAISNIYAGFKVLQLTPMIKFIDIVDTEERKKLSKKIIIYSFILLLLILFIEALIGSLVGSFIEFFLLENITQDIRFIIIAYAPGGILSVILAPRLGRIADKLNPKYTLASVSVIGAVMTWLLIQSTQIWQFSLIFLVDSTVVATAGLMLTKIVSTVSKERRGTIFGFHDFMNNLGHIIGPIMGGALWDSASFAPFSAEVGGIGTSLGSRKVWQANHNLPFIVSIIIEGCLALLYPIAIIILGKNIDLKGNKEKEPLEMKIRT